MRLRHINHFLLLCCVFSVFSLQEVKAQDPHFSQTISTPLLLNPALTGVMNTDARITTNYRTQWGSVATPFQTMSVAVDFSPLRYIFNTDDMLGIGFYVMNDKAGVSELSNTQLQFSLAYSKSLNGEGNNYLSIGGQMGYVQNRLNAQKLTFDNQIEGNYINTSLSSGEASLFENQNYWDASVGIGWHYAPEKSTSLYAGASAYHLNEPNVSFMGDDTELLWRKYTAYAGGEFRVNYMLSLMPRGFFLKQGKSSEFTAGSLFKFNIESQYSQQDISALVLGALYRWGDAIILIARYDFDSFGLSFSYDLTSSQLHSVSNGFGAMEIALSYKTNLSRNAKNNRPMAQPSF